MKNFLKINRALAAKKKKILFFTVALLGISNAFAVVNWDGTTKTAWTEGAGTADSPYIISSPNNLAYLAQQVNAGNTYSGKYFKQTNDFDLLSNAWTSIGTSSNKFSGNYDGGNKYISNLKAAIFGYINNATIQNLTMQGANLRFYWSATLKYHGVLVNQTAGTCYITNCHNRINVLGDSHIGGANGFVGEVTGTKLVMTRCSNTKLAQYSSGFVGKVSARTEIKECYCSCSISSTSDMHGAFVTYANTDYPCVIERCYFINNGSAFASVVYEVGDATMKSCYVRGNVGVSSFVKWQDSYFVSSGTSSYSGTTELAVNCYAKYPVCPDHWIVETEELMKTKEFLTELNKFSADFTMDLEGINDGYPILKWQAGTRYKLTASCDANRGSVNGGGEFPMGYSATLEATPKNGCTFVGWSDGNTDNPRMVTVSGDASYVAQFTKSSYTIYVNQDCTGNIE